MSQKYMEEALKWMGTKEVAGPVANKDIVMFDKYTSLKATSDEVPWCSSFANYVVHACGDKGTNSAAARSWLDWGKAIDKPEYGCLVIIDRRDKGNPNAAHVTFYICDVEPAHIQCVGGNQGDMVKMSVYPKDKVLGYRAAP